MLKINKITVSAVVLILLAAMWGYPWGEIACAQTSGGVSRDYDDSYNVKHRVIRQPDLDIEVWVDKGDGVTYNPGEEIKIYFQASTDCYVVIYNIDTRGYVHLLYPVDPDDDFYVEGGRTYRIPDRFDDYELTVDGPDGLEYIQAVASWEPLDLPNFPGEYEYEGQVYAYQLDGEDPFEFMAEINSEIACYDYASDVCIFSVEYPHPQWYYHPRMVYIDPPMNIYLGGVYVDYPWGVEIWIDGVFYGITPLTIPSLIVGRHYVSFWYHGCWIWRDWFHVRRDFTFTLWADCHDRYRYVRERYVEKNYREEKAKRRRGIADVGGLVRPMELKETRLVAKAEASRIQKDRIITEDKSIKRRSIENKAQASQLKGDIKPREVERTIKAADIKDSPRSDKERAVTKRKMKAVPIKQETKTIKSREKIEKSTRSDKSSANAEKIDKGKVSKPSASEIKKSSPKKKTVKASPVSGKQATKSSGSKPEKKRR
jgi:hypothetical protein